MSWRKITWVWQNKAFLHIASMLLIITNLYIFIVNDLTCMRVGWKLLKWSLEALLTKQINHRKVFPSSIGLFPKPALIWLILKQCKYTFKNCLLLTVCFSRSWFAFCTNCYITTNFIWWLTFTSLKGWQVYLLCFIDWT